MRVLISGLAGLAFAGAAAMGGAAEPASCIWHAERLGMAQARWPVGDTRRVAPLSPQAIVMGGQGCGAWVREGAGLRQYDSTGLLLGTIDLAQLRQRHAADALVAAAIAMQIDAADAMLALDARDGSLWLAAGTSLLHLDAGGKVLASLFHEQPVVQIEVDLLGTLWVLDEVGLGRYRADGSLLARYALGEQYPDVQRVAFDTLGGKLWLIAPRRVWQVEPTQLAVPLAPLAWREGLAYQAGQTVSFAGHLYRAQLAHIAPEDSDWTPAAAPALWQYVGTQPTVSVPQPWRSDAEYRIGETVRYQDRVYRALASHTTYPQTGWTPANAPALWRLESDESPDAPVVDEARVIEVSEPLADVAINPKSGELWLLGQHTLWAYGWDVQQRYQADLATWDIVQPQALRFDAAGETFWLHSAGKLTPFGVDGTARDARPVAADHAVLGTTALRILPTLVLKDPPPKDGGSQPTFVFQYDAMCSGRPCDFDRAHYEGYQWQVSLDDGAVTGQLVFDAVHHTARLTPTQPLADGVHLLRASVTDQLGSRSTQLEYVFNVTPGALPTSNGDAPAGDLPG
ncbi:carbohydrate-binding protein [Chitiniphilus eburneus]|uniref:carbohydrate-binding protein n=1 Tax=Chitiniphilus eburneus TaxID=2571148 RepID=UPI0035D0AF4D